LSDAALWAALAGISGLGQASLRSLMQAFPEPEAVWSASGARLIPLLNPRLAAEIAAGPDQEYLNRVRAWLAEPGNHLLSMQDARFPRLLSEIADPPPLLYVKGDLASLDRPGLAIVGSRNATPQGEANAQAFARTLSDAGLAIVSGLALGIDTAAHRGGLAGMSGSVAVTGTGLDIVYPARNRELAHELAQRGALVSEFPLGTPSIAGNFPRRNRIISGLSLGCLVVEAAPSSGSLITAQLALEQGREVFAIPGSIHSPQSRGCHRLIKQGAKLVENAEDILEELHLSDGARPSTSASPGAEHPMLTSMGYDPISVDRLCALSGLTAERVSAILLAMELSGLVAPIPGGLYQRIRA
jgi:DNA processing protein